MEEQGTATRKPMTGHVASGFLVLLCSVVFFSCSDLPRNPTVTYKPKFFLANTGIPFLDEHNILSVQLVEVDNPFPEAKRKRIYSLFFNLDGRGRFALHAETGDNVGKNIHMFIHGQSVGYHPIRAPIANGVFPILLSVHLGETDARFLLQQLKRTIDVVKKERNR
jgi:hypothetical protein